MTEQHELKVGAFNGLDLFSGIGGISVALEPWVRTVAYCEQERYAQSVLLSRMESGDLQRAPIWDDVQTLTGKMLPPIDIIFGGFPCQDISAAGRGAGLEGKRSGLFYEIIRLVEETRPSFVYLENVPAIRTRGLRQVIGAFTDLRYDCRWTCVSAAELGAPHLRKRWFLLAHAADERCNGEASIAKTPARKPKRPDAASRDGETQSLAHADGIGRLEGFAESEVRQWGLDADRGGTSMADAISERSQRHIGKEPSHTESSESFGRAWWTTEPDVGRVAHGIPQRVDRLKGLGNSVVPIQVREAFKRLSGLQ